MLLDSHKVLAIYILTMALERAVKCSQGKYLMPVSVVHVSYLLILNRVCELEGIEYAEDTLQFTFPGIGANLLTMALEGFLFFGLTILLEQKFFIHKIKGLLKSPGAEEVDSVFAESEVSIAV